MYFQKRYIIYGILLNNNVRYKYTGENVYRTHKVSEKLTVKMARTLGHGIWMHNSCSEIK